MSSPNAIRSVLAARAEKAPTMAERARAKMMSGQVADLVERLRPKALTESEFWQAKGSRVPVELITLREMAGLSGNFAKVRTYPTSR